MPLRGLRKGVARVTGLRGTFSGKREASEERAEEDASSKRVSKKVTLVVNTDEIGQSSRRNSWKPRSSWREQHGRREKGAHVAEEDSRDGNAKWFHDDHMNYASQGGVHTLPHRDPEMRSQAEMRRYSVDEPPKKRPQSKRPSSWAGLRLFGKERDNGVVRRSLVKAPTDPRDDEKAPSLVRTRQHFVHAGTDADLKPSGGNEAGDTAPNYDSGKPSKKTAERTSSWSGLWRPVKERDNGFIRQSLAEAEDTFARDDKQTEYAVENEAPLPARQGQDEAQTGAPKLSGEVSDEADSNSKFREPPKKVVERPSSWVGLLFGKERENGVVRRSVVEVEAPPDYRDEENELSLVKTQHCFARAGTDADSKQNGGKVAGNVEPSRDMGKPPKKLVERTSNWSGLWRPVRERDNRLILQSFAEAEDTAGRGDKETDYWVENENPPFARRGQDDARTGAPEVLGKVSSESRPDSKLREPAKKFERPSTWAGLWRSEKQGEQGDALVVRNSTFEAKDSWDQRDEEKEASNGRNAPSSARSFPRDARDGASHHSGNTLGQAAPNLNLFVPPKYGFEGTLGLVGQRRFEREEDAGVQPRSFVEAKAPHDGRDEEKDPDFELRNQPIRSRCASNDVPGCASEQGGKSSDVADQNLISREPPNKMIDRTRSRTRRQQLGNKQNNDGAHRGLMEAFNRSNRYDAEGRYRVEQNHSKLASRSLDGVTASASQLKRKESSEAEPETFLSERGKTVAEVIRGEPSSSVEPRRSGGGQTLSSGTNSHKSEQAGVVDRHDKRKGDAVQPKQPTVARRDLNDRSIGASVRSSAALGEVVPKRYWNDRSRNENETKFQRRPGVKPKALGDENMPGIVQRRVKEADAAEETSLETHQAAPQRPSSSRRDFTEVSADASSKNKTVVGEIAPKLFQNDPMKKAAEMKGESSACNLPNSMSKERDGGGAFRSTNGGDIASCRFEEKTDVGIPRRPALADRNFEEESADASSFSKMRLGKAAPQSPRNRSEKTIKEQNLDRAGIAQTKFLGKERKDDAIRRNSKEIRVCTDRQGGGASCNRPNHTASLRRNADESTTCASVPEKASWASKSLHETSWNMTADAPTDSEGSAMMAQPRTVANHGFDQRSNLTVGQTRDRIKLKPSVKVPSAPKKDDLRPAEQKQPAWMNMKLRKTPSSVATMEIAASPAVEEKPPPANLSSRPTLDGPASAVKKKKSNDSFGREDSHVKKDSDAKASIAQKRVSKEVVGPNEQKAPAWTNFRLRKSTKSIDILEETPISIKAQPAEPVVVSAELAANQSRSNCIRELPLKPSDGKDTAQKNFVSRRHHHPPLVNSIELAHKRASKSIPKYADKPTPPAWTNLKLRKTGSSIETLDRKLSASTEQISNLPATAEETKSTKVDHASTPILTQKEVDRPKQMLQGEWKLSEREDESTTSPPTKARQDVLGVYGRKGVAESDNTASLAHALPTEKADVVDRVHRDTVDAPRVHLTNVAPSRSLPGENVTRSPLRPANRQPEMRLPPKQKKNSLTPSRGPSMQLLPTREMTPPREKSPPRETRRMSSESYASPRGNQTPPLLSPSSIDHECARSPSPCSTRRMRRSSASPLHPAALSPRLGELLAAAEDGDVSTISSLLRTVDVDASDPEDGYSALLVAAEEGRFDAVQFLVERAGAKIDCRDAVGRTPLYAAAVADNAHIVAYLVRRGADPLIADYDGRQVFWATCAVHARDSAVALLDEAKARKISIDIDARDNCGLTAIEFAAHRGHATILELLRERGAQENPRSRGRLALF